MRRRRLAALPGLAVGLAGVLMPSPAAAATRSCGWSAHFSADELNILSPDTAVHYWTAVVPIPDGGHLELAGRFPHARYLSFNQYSSQLRSVDGLTDVQIQPDVGSANPFIAGADRTAAARDYTLRVVGGQPPASG